MPGTRTTGDRYCMNFASRRPKRRPPLMEAGTMTVHELGVLEPVPVRGIWQHEANDLTPWLAESSHLLAETLGMEDFEVEGTEVPVGGYKADLVLRDGKSTVVVENMFGSTDHDHIGKLITYAAGLDASYAVLLAEEFRPEHRSALNWLNRISTEDCSFFGLVLEAWRIGDSPPAPRFRVDVKPDDWSRAVRASGAAHVSERNAIYQNFWTKVMEDLHQVDKVWRRIKTPQAYHWMDFRRDYSTHGVAYLGAFSRHESRPCLRAVAYLYAGDAGEWTSDLYRMLESRRGEIETAFGGKLDWLQRENVRASRIAARFPEPLSIDDADEDARAWLVDALVRLRRAMNPVLEELWAMDEWPE
ncbi:MAG: DUF4268 domain-containing protein [Acidimicrobiaceae bacterium]|nr:DUF4268 domain-containing protein [Acidimicrobiaceae bacterium]MYK74535.1 DUF4268 domain-containing protein [Acidimicrobiaceae bacterium]